LEDTTTPPITFFWSDVAREGRIVAPNHDADGDLVGVKVDKEKEQKEFRIALIGDSPVEGIGNKHHDTALSGETARAFAQKVVVGMKQKPHQHSTNKGDCYDSVRYWSYGKSGLTARGELRRRWCIISIVL